MNTKADAMHILVKMTGEKLTLGNVISAIRQGEDWTQAELADILGVSRHYVCDLEQGRRMVSPKTAETFAIKLGYSPTQFVRLCLQDVLDKQGLHYQLDVQVAVTRHPTSHHLNRTNLAALRNSHVI